MIDENKLELILAKTGDMCLKRRAKLLLKELDPNPNDKILDVGCGDGYYLYLLSNLGKFNLAGIDSDKKALIAASKQVKNKSMKLISGDIMSMPFKDESFDKIVCSEVLEHLRDDKNALIEMKRVLKKNGILCITVPHWNYPFFWDPVNYLLQRGLKTHVKNGFWSGVWANHIRLYRVKELKNIVKAAGFKIDKLECLTHYGLPFNHYLVNIGFKLRTSRKVSKKLKASMSKFNRGSKKTWFDRIFTVVNWLDRRNDKIFLEKVSTVGLFLKARKV